MNNKPIIKELVVSASPTVIWNAITNPEVMNIWYFNLPGFVAEVGYSFRFYAETKDKRYLHLCKITEVVPLERLSYSWVYDGYEGESQVTFEILPQDNKTMLRLTHKGIGSFPKDNIDLKRENFDGGWESIICESLRNYLEQHELSS